MSWLSGCAPSLRPEPASRPSGRLRFRAWLASADVALLLTLTACAAAPRPAPPPPPPPRPTTVTLDESQVGALADLLRMADRRALDAERWTSLVRYPEPAVRVQAVLAAGRIADPRTVTPLLESLADSSVGVRAAAAFALGRVADTAAAVTTGLGRVLEARDSAALQAPAALARLNTPAASELVRHRLEGLRSAAAPLDIALARELLLALWRFRGAQPGAAELAASFASAPDPGVRWAALYVLTRIGTPTTVGSLVAHLGDPDTLVRATAARGLRRGAVDSAGAISAARAGLQPLLADAHAHVRINAARTLAAFRDPGDAPALLPLLQDADGNVRAAVAEALGNLPPGTGAAPSALRALAADGNQPLALRAAALGSLTRLDSAAARPVIADWAAAPGWLQRFYAARVAAGLAWSSTGDLLQRLSRDADPRVQGEAFGGLASADSTLPLAPLFLEGLGAPDPLVRAQAANALARRRDPAFFPALMQAYDRSQRDTINDAALAAVDALAGIRDLGVPVATSFFLRFRPTADPVVRARVAQRFGTGQGTWGEPRPVDTGRNDDFYRQVVRTELAPVLAGGAPPQVRIRSSRGDVVLALDPVAAPLTVENFLRLIREGFYHRPELRWHRVVPNFVLQDGDPRGDGSGGPPWVIRDEINPLHYERGTLGMALSGPDTGGSQFFITHSPQPHLDGGYTIFGHVVAGMAAADAILQDDPILGIEVIQ